MSNTLSTLSIGFVGNNKGLMGSIEESVGGVGRLAQTAGGVLVPAFASVGAASQGAEVGMGRLEHLIEVLGLRVMATSTQISKLAQTSRRMGGANKQIQSSADAATRSLENEQVAVRGLASILSQLSTQARAEGKHSGIMEVINEDGELSKIRRLRLEMTALQGERARQRTGQRITEIGGEVTQLTGQRDASHTNLREKSELNMRINALMAERLQLDIQLRSQLDGQDAATRQISSNQQQINGLLSQAQRKHEEEKQAHREILELKAKAAVPPKPQNLAQMKSEFKAIDSQLVATEKRWENINKQMHDSVVDAQQLKDLEEDMESTEDRLVMLRKQQGVSVDKILVAEKQSNGIEKQIEQSLLQQRAVLKPKLAAEAKITREKREHKALLLEAVRLEKLTVLEAIRLGHQFDQIANKNLKKVNEGLDRVQKGTGKMNFAMQQFGFMIEDGASQMGTRGLAGAVGAMSNNLTAMVGVLAKNPMTLIFTSIGVAITQVLIQTGALKRAFEALGFGGDELADDNENLAKSYDVVGDAIKAVIAQEQALADIRSEDSVKGAERTAKALAALLRRQEADLKVSLAKRQEERDEARKKELQEAISEARQKAQMEGERIGLSGRRGQDAGDEIDRQNRVIRLAKAEIGEIDERNLARINKIQGAELEVQVALKEIEDTKKRIAANDEKRPELIRAAAGEHRNNLQQIQREIIAERERRSGIGKEVALSKEIEDNERRRKSLQKDMVQLMRQRGGTEEQQTQRAKTLLSHEKELSGLKANRVRLDGIGDTALGKADDMLSKAKERAGLEESEDKRRSREQEQFNASLKTAVQTRRISAQQAERAFGLLKRTHALERDKERLERNRKLLRGQIQATGDTPQVQTAVDARSAESRGIVMQAMIDSQQADAQASLVATMTQNGNKLKDIETAIKGIGTLNLKKK